MIYLASPYSHESPIIRTLRFMQTREYVSTWLRHGVPLFSPIVYCHQFVDMGFGTSAEAWHDFNYEIAQRAGALWVLKLEGWKSSRGVAEEIDWFTMRGISPKYKEVSPWRE